MVSQGSRLCIRRCVKRRTFSLIIFLLTIVMLTFKIGDQYNGSYIGDEALPLITEHHLSRVDEEQSVLPAGEESLKTDVPYAVHYSHIENIVKTPIHGQKPVVSSLPKNSKLKVMMMKYKNETEYEHETLANKKGSTKMRSCKYGQMRRLPSAIIIGSRKAGTRATLEYINMHPDVEIVNREILFFNKFYHRGYDYYKSQMPCSTASQIVIEKTPAYMLNESVAELIYHMNKDTKIILIVRDPVQRTLSDYVQFQVRDRIELINNRTIEEVAFLEQSLEPDVNFDAVRWSIYYKYFFKYLNYFPMSQIYIVDGDMLVKNPYKEIHELESFLGLEHKINNNSFYWNATKGFYCYKRPSVGNLCFPGEKGRPHPYVQDDYLRAMYRFFEPLNERFFAQIGTRFNWTYPGSIQDANYTQHIISGDLNTKTMYHHVQNSSSNCHTTSRVLVIGSSNISIMLLVKLMDTYDNLSTIERENNFFVDPSYFKTGIDNYITHMPCDPLNNIVVDWSTTYFYNKEVPERVHQMNPHTFVIILLEDPVKRISTHYEEFVRKYGTTTENDVLNKIYNSSGLEHDILEHSIYYKYLFEWYLWFNSNNILTLSHEKFMKNPQGYMKEIEHFLRLEHISREEEQFHQIIQQKSENHTTRNEPFSQNTKRNVPTSDSFQRILYNYFKDWNNLIYRLTKHNFNWTYDSLAVFRN